MLFLMRLLLLVLIPVVGVHGQFFQPNNTWSLNPTSPITPQSRSFHASAVYPGHYYLLHGGLALQEAQVSPSLIGLVISGVTGGLIEDDIWILGLNSLNWVSIHATPIPDLSMHTMTLGTLVTTDVFFIFGGLILPPFLFEHPNPNDPSAPLPQGTSMINSVYAIEAAGITNKSPILLNITGQRPQPRSGHTAVAVNNGILIYGGCGHWQFNYRQNNALECLQLLDDMWMLNTVTLAWVKLNQAPGTSPGPLVMHVASVLGTTMYIIGGTNYSVSSNETRPQLYSGFSIDVSSVQSGQSVGPWVLIDSLPKTSVFAGRPGITPSADKTSLQLLTVSNHPVQHNMVVWQYVPSVGKWQRLDRSTQWAQNRPATLTGGFDSHAFGSTYITYGQVFKTADSSSINSLWQYGLLPQAACNNQDCSTDEIVWAEGKFSGAASPRAYTATVRANSSFFIFGGIEAQSTVAAPLVWRYSLQLGEWSTMPYQPNATIPEGRVGPGAVSLYGEVVHDLLGYEDTPAMILYGGYMFPNQYTSLFNDLWVFPIRTVPPPPGPFQLPGLGTELIATTWTRLCPDTKLPRRAQMSMMVFQRTQILVYGGSNGTDVAGCDYASSVLPIFSINLLSCGVFDLQIGPQPPIRQAHVAGKVVVDGEPAMIIFGGYSGCNPIHSDVWYLFLRNMSWYEVPTKNKVPGVYNAAAGVVNDVKFVIYGGFAPSNIQTYHINSFDVRTRRWTLIVASVPKSVVPFQVAGEGLSVIGTQMFTFGGSTTETLSNDIHVINLACNPGTQAESFADVCTPCGLGQFSDCPGCPCKNCPGASFSPRFGAYSATNCSVCEPNFCKHGTCSLTSDQLAICECQFGWRGATCDTHWLAYLLIGLGSLAVIIAGGIVVSIAVRRRFRGVKIQSQLTQQLLEVELQNFESAFAISPADLEIESDKPIASGSYGNVYLATLYGQHRVAVKKLKRMLVELDEFAIQDFEQEVRLLRSLRHRHIVFFYGTGVFESEEVPFLVTEYLGNGSLYDVLHSPDRQSERDNISLKQRIGFALDTSKGMAFLHDLDPPRIHRDLKSPNVLVSETWVCKVTDFGTAKLFGQLTSDAESDVSSNVRTRSNRSHNSNEAPGAMTQGLGTLLWSAPEVVDGQPYGLSADVYSFAIVLYELLTLQLPFHDVNTTWRIMEMVVNGQRPQIDVAASSLAAEASVLMQECWSQDPDGRPLFTMIVERLKAIL